MIGICLVTYNHESYITKALDSVLEQIDCSEKIRIYIGDDCSTDGTSEICRCYAERYPELIRLFVYSKNKGLVKNTINLLKYIIEDGCNYVAMLDGDDYWCDSLKLKKQLEYLDSHPDFGFVHTRNYLLVDDILVKPQRKSPPIGNVFSSITSLPIANCTAFYRKELLESINLDELCTRGFMSLDYVMYALFSAITKFGFIEDYTAVWRRGHTSVSNTNDEKRQINYLENDRAMWRYLGEKFPDRFSYNENSWNDYYNLRVFNIAFKFKDYSLAHSILQCLNSGGSFSFRIKKFCAKNRVLFIIWTFLKSYMK